MEISTEGLVIAKHKFKEKSIILTIFTAKEGILKGVCIGGTSKKSFYKLQLGNIIEAHWKARLEQHLGNFKVELKDSSLPFVFTQPQKLLAIQTTCDLLYHLMPERDSIPELYQATVTLLHSLLLDNFFYYYIQWELNLLKYLGYGIDFSKCGVCKQPHQLKYVSPKTGVAVCEKIGLPYKDRLLTIPSFFSCSHQVNNSNPVVSSHIDIKVEEKMQALLLTGHFLKSVANHYHKSLPYSRNMLVKSFLN